MDEHRDAEALRRSAALREQLEAVTRRTAEVADHAARVHDEVAETHERLEQPLLDPDQLRRHAQESRDFAAAERREADRLRDG